jgi:predicted ester cyclase
MKSLIKEALLVKLAVLIVAVVFVAGCQQQPDYSKELKPLVDKYNAAWESGNVEGLDAIFDSKFVRHSDVATSAEGLDNLKKVITGFKAAYPDLKLVSNEEVYSKDRFAGRWTLTGTNTGPGEMPPTGKAITMWGINIIHFANGKIVEEWDSFDNLPSIQQLGFTMNPPAEAKR